MNVSGHDLGSEDRTFIIAEAGSNHNGDLETAKKLVDVAADAGADAVKFQLFEADKLYVENSGTDNNLDKEASIHDVISTLELPREWISDLHSYCEKQDILFLATPFDEHAVDILDEYVPAYKVASSSVTHLPFLETVGATGKPVLMSTGAHDLKEVETAVETLEQAGASDVALFHCVAAYPTPLEKINVKTIDTLREEFSVPVGLSDHTEEPAIAPCAAVSRGAAMIEKHITLDRSMDGPDHSFAIEPDELDEMVTSIRQTESALGDRTVDIQTIESHTYEVARRSVHATHDIEPEERITEQNTAILRPGNRVKGVPPGEYDDILGTTATTTIPKDAGVTWEDVAADPQSDSSS